MRLVLDEVSLVVVVGLRELHDAVTRTRLIIRVLVGVGVVAVHLLVVAVDLQEDVVVGPRPGVALDPDVATHGLVGGVEPGDSLERLGVHRIDILLAHDIDVPNQGSRANVNAKVDQLMAGGYHAMERLRNEGVIGAFGAGVNEWEVCQQLTERGDYDLFLLAGRYTLLEQEALNSFLPLAQSRGIGIIIGGPYNSGILATGPREGAFYNYDPAPQDILDKVTRIQAVCQAHGVRLVDAAFKFPLLHPCTVSVIPGGQGLEEMDSNVTAASADIPADLWAELKAEGLMRQEAPV